LKRQKFGHCCQLDSIRVGRQDHFLRGAEIAPKNSRFSQTFGNFLKEFYFFQIIKFFCPKTFAISYKVADYIIFHSETDLSADLGKKQTQKIPSSNFLRQVVLSPAFLSVLRLWRYVETMRFVRSIDALT
jgi:hypothetical protein